MTPQVDSVNINSRDDWRHTIVAGGVQGNRFELFPGQSDMIRFGGPLMGKRITLIGLLEGTGASVAAAIADLNAEVAAWEAKAVPGAGPYVVSIDSVDYENCTLLPLPPAGNIQVRKQAGDGVTVRLARRVTLTFQQLIPD